MDDWLERCRDGIERKEGSKLLNLFRGFGGINQDYGFLTRIINSPQYTRTGGSDPQKPWLKLRAAR